MTEPRKIIRLQPAALIDNLTSLPNGETVEDHRMPYPFFADEQGLIQRQDLWRGKFFRVVGFARDLARQQVDLWWEDAAQDPQAAVGMYLVTQSEDRRSMVVHTTAIESAEESTP